MCRETSLILENFGKIPFSFRSSIVKHSTRASEDVSNISSDTIFALAIVAPRARPGNI